MHRIFVTIAILGLVAPNGAVGQAPIDSALGRVRPGDVIRVRTLDGRIVDSRLLAIEAAPVQVPALNPAPLRLRLGGQPVPVAATSVDSLWARAGSARTGALVGAIALAIPSFFYSRAVCAGLDEVRCDWEAVGHYWPVLLGGTLAGAGVGALIGAAVGSAVPRWDLRFARHAATASPGAAPGSRVYLSLAVTF